MWSVQSSWVVGGRLGILAGLLHIATQALNHTDVLFSSLETILSRDCCLSKVAQCAQPLCTSASHHHKEITEAKNLYL